MSTPATGAPATGAARLARGAGLAALTVALSAVAHALGGGHTPSAGMLAGLGALLLPPCVGAAGRRLRPWVAAALLSGGQVALHAAFSVLMACRTTPATMLVPDVHGTHAGHGATTMATHCVAMAEQGRPLLGGASMLVFHALATVLTAAGVCAAERLLWWVRREVTTRLTAPAPLAPLPRRGPALPVPDRFTPATALHLRLPPARRGPPRALVAHGASPS